MTSKFKTIILCATMVLSTASVSAALPDDLDRYEKLIESRQLTEAHVNELAALALKYPTNSRVQLALGLALDLVGLPEEAYPHFVLADKYGPSDPQAILGILHQLLAKGDDTAAHAMLEQALKRFPDNPEVLMVVGRSLKDNRHPQEAEETLWRAYNSPGKRPLGLATQIGELYVANKPDLALKMANEDLAREPRHFLALSVKANAHAQMGEYRKALAPLAVLFAKSGTWGNTAQLYSHCLYWDGRYAEAIQPALFSLAKSAAYMGGNLPAVPMLAVIFDHLDEKTVGSGIDTFYKRTAGSDTVKDPFHFYLSRALMMSDKGKLAYDEINRFLEHDPSNFDAILLKAQIEETRLGLYEKALESYRLAHALLPYNAQCNASMMRLEERLNSRKTDLAWQFKDAVRKFFHLPPD